MKSAGVLALLLLCACGQEEATSPAAEPAAQPVESATTPAAAETAEPPIPPKGRFAPRDECGSLPGAGQFRQRLIEAVRLRDADALAALADPGIKLDFGGGGGIAELRQRLASAEPSLWRELDALIPLGCAANEHGGLTMPWVFDQDIGETDPYSAMLVMGEDERVLAEPRASARQIATVSWDLVEIMSLDPERPFQPVKLANGREGYIATGKLRAVIDYRLIADRVGGRWKITALIAGD